MPQPPQPLLFDAHCHLAPEGGTASERDAGAPAAGRILCGVEPGEWRRVADAAAGWSGTIAAYGVHPWWAGPDRPAWEETLGDCLRADPDAWVGEIGLDGIKTADAPFERQIEVFARQLRLARKLGRRVNLHCVKAWREMPPLLDSEYLAGAGAPTFVAHSFAGPDEFVRAFAERGAYFSVGPLFSRRNSRRDRGRVARLPLERIVLESDAFLVPGRDAGGGLAHALGWLAEVRNVPEADMAAMVRENTRRLLANG